MLGHLAVAAIAVTAIGAAVGGPISSPVEASGVANSDWLGVVNAYRAQSGLSPVTENPAWSDGGRNHSCWMLLNGIAHDEAPGTAGFTNAGDDAGNSGNVAVSSNANATARNHIDLWMSGPFHAIGVLRSSLTQTGFGLCTSPPNPSATTWKSAGTLDVVRGNNWGAPKPPTPVVFPGNGSTTSLTRFVAETPDPRTFCNWGGRSVGLPLIALMPSAVTAANATLNGPNGPIPTCVLHKANTTSTASAILGGDNAVVIVPDSPLVAGAYSVTVGSNGGNAAWSFNVDPNAQLGAASAPPAPPGPLPTTAALTAGDPFQPIAPFRFADSRIPRTILRLVANQLVRVPIAGQAGLPADMTSVSANFTAAGATAAGYLTASNCAETNPSFSTLNFEAYDGVPNQAIIPLDRGALCLFASAETDVIIDINGYVSPGATQWFNPVVPRRLLDTRVSQPLRAGEVLRVDVEGNGSPAPDAAVAVAVNLTGVTPDQDGWVRAFPCDVAETEVSSMNPRVGLARANSAIVPTAA
ncbi:MAG TPA: CAP domain-containing protein, partial [Ilumatobacteraceae bacterium]|nr:CAP domain-containing protein [Ilumatobacteraceae bacterium]